MIESIVVIRRFCFFANLPNLIYINKDNLKTNHGFKQIKDKQRYKIMVCMEE